MSKHITDFSAVTVVDLDLAKQVFQIHAIDASGRAFAALNAHARQAAGVAQNPRPARAVASQPASAY